MLINDSLHVLTAIPRLIVLSCSLFYSNRTRRRVRPHRGDKWRCHGRGNSAGTHGCRDQPAESGNGVVVTGVLVRRCPIRKRDLRYFAGRRRCHGVVLCQSDDARMQFLWRASAARAESAVTRRSRSRVRCRPRSESSIFQ
jgi:hypothetical protein